MWFKKIYPLISATFIVLFAGFLSTSMSMAGSSWISYLSGKDMVRSYLALPEGKGPFPGLIVIHEFWGLNGWVKAQADEFARRGYAALAVDLYRGAVANDAEAAHELMRGLPEDRATRDLEAAAMYLRARSDIEGSRLASIGWCMGGGYSLEVALAVKPLSACVICYGRLVTDTARIRSIDCPVLGIFGEDDRGIPPASVREFERTAKGEGRDVVTYIYPNCGHAFMNSENKTSYRQGPAEDAWKKIYVFLDAHLKPSKSK